MKSSTPSKSKTRAIVLGCMRVVDAEVLRAALDLGVDRLDTSDAYLGNEALIRQVVNDRAVRITTKGGLTRPGGRWVPDGRRKHLLKAAEASCERLGRVPDLYLLHALDPRTRLETSIRALAAIRDRGLAKAVGVSNVRLGELRRACEIAPIEAVQLPMSWLDDTAIRGGVVEHCLAEGIEVQAHSPFGGPKKSSRLGRDPVLKRVASRLGRSPWAVAAAWLTSLGVAPVLGPTRVETVRDLLPLPELDAQALDELDAAFPAARILRVPRQDRRPAPEATGDVVMLMGSPASGKSTAVLPFVEQGYHRLNRDLVGGTLARVAESLDQVLARGERRVILDNTYPARHQRSRVIETAWAHGVPVRCLHKTTGLEDARYNACLRMVRRHGRLLEPGEMKKLARSEPNSFPPRVLQQWPGKLEVPELQEGFASITEIPFEREITGSGRAVLLDANALHVTELQLRQAIDDGWLVFAAGWSGGGPAPGDVRVGDLRIETLWCTHPTGPAICWCRPPLPGLKAVLAVRHDIGEWASL